VSTFKPDASGGYAIIARVQINGWTTTPKPWRPWSKKESRRHFRKELLRKKNLNANPAL